MRSGHKDGDTDGRMGKPTNEWMTIRKKERDDGRKNGRMNKRMNKTRDEWTNGWINQRIKGKGGLTTGGGGGGGADK